MSTPPPRMPRLPLVDPLPLVDRLPLVDPAHHHHHHHHACAVESVAQLETVYQNLTLLPGHTACYVTQPDAAGIYQIYSVDAQGVSTPLSATQVPGGPAVGLNKLELCAHPSGAWLIVGVEQEGYADAWLPQGLKIGFLQSGVWLNIWAVTPDGLRWVQLTDFDVSAAGDGYTGVAFTSDGNTAVWAQMSGGVSSSAAFGVWRLMVADWVVTSGVPAFANIRDITPAGATWIEPGNFAPDNETLLISTDIGLAPPIGAYGMDQWSINVVTGALEQLTATPTVWDEHGLYSPNGKKIAFMSSVPYPDAAGYNVLNLKTEFMLMNADGSGLQQLTHFNVPGYPESQLSNRVAAVAQWLPDGSLFGVVMGPGFALTNWSIRFHGPCGNST